MHTIKPSEFKATCLAQMDEAAPAGEPLLVTKNGKPVAELHPCTVERPASPFGLHKGKTKVLGDIVEPIDMEEWEALS